MALEDAWNLLKAFCPNCGKLGMMQPDGTMICSDEAGCGFKTSDPVTSTPRSPLDSGREPKNTEEVKVGEGEERRFIRRPPRFDLTEPLSTPSPSGIDRMFKPPPWSAGVKQSRSKRDEKATMTADELEEQYMNYRYGPFAPRDSGVHTTDWFCDKCHAKDATVEIKQIRAADEAPSRLYTCKKCGYKDLED